MKIKATYDDAQFTPWDHRWSAIDEDTYDGAEDSHPSCKCRGFGATEAEAINDLVEQLVDVLERELAEWRDMEGERTKELQSACADLAGAKASTEYAVGLTRDSYLWRKFVGLWAFGEIHIEGENVFWDYSDQLVAWLDAQSDLKAESGHRDEASHGRGLAKNPSPSGLADDADKPAGNNEAPKRTDASGPVGLGPFNFKGCDVSFGLEPDDGGLYIRFQRDEDTAILSIDPTPLHVLVMPSSGDNTRADGVGAKEAIVALAGADRFGMFEDYPDDNIGKREASTERSAPTCDMIASTLALAPGHAFQDRDAWERAARGFERKLIEAEARAPSTGRIASDLNRVEWIHFCPLEDKHVGTAIGRDCACGARNK